MFEVFLVFLRLGLTSFGGPIAHLGYFHEEFVKRRAWVDEHTYADLVALCQFLPGPASSQVGMALGLSRAGYLGAIAAWLGFTLPSAVILILFAFGVNQFQLGNDGWLHGLKIVAVAVVAQAIWAMAVRLCPDKKRATIAVSAAVCSIVSASIYSTSALVQLFVILVGGLSGILFLRNSQVMPHTPIKAKVSRRVGGALLLVFAVVLAILPIAAKTSSIHALKLFDSFFRAGSLVFGGGHVVLPLLQAELVPSGWVSQELFMAGYGAAQGIPGPLFCFAAYLGAVAKGAPTGLLGAIICLMAVFLPSFLLIVGVLPFWEKVRSYSEARHAMLGINAAVVGLLIAAFYNPVWTSAIFNGKDFAFASVCFLLLVFWKTPSWIVVLLSALLCWTFY